MARILIAEDDPSVRVLVSRALGLEGHEVTVAEDGELALDILVECDGDFDFVLSDIRMPAMTGIELAHEIGASWPDLPVLLMTGYAEQKEAADDLAAIIEGVVEKPFSIVEIRREVGRILAEREAAKQSDETENAGNLSIRRCA
ncbi:response regulator [Aurantimonas sp. C2-6-R+9]|uniref:response regulator n=1 Tax=unclassified Aurantimonas TaxID=2638230 RepID=UPI002E17B925|nr:MULTISPECIES: response regulator [unclassified Aurantimonas]MEC5292208.1 response regulator [Aurantimonas sp. C2-3-R2]MEC5382343.1 response regulator [Aurantimonas sp. C2-6-R+9]MEC5413294.1 response regulator [Aurantimonas sp. C2-4-R8]